MDQLVTQLQEVSGWQRYEIEDLNILLSKIENVSLTSYTAYWDCHFYGDTEGNVVDSVYEDSPLEAVIKLAIKLFDQGYLQKQDNDIT